MLPQPLVLVAVSGLRISLTKTLSRESSMRRASTSPVKPSLSVVRHHGAKSLLVRNSLFRMRRISSSCVPNSIRSQVCSTSTTVPTSSSVTCPSRVQALLMSAVRILSQLSTAPTTCGWTTVSSLTVRMVTSISPTSLTSSPFPGVTSAIPITLMCTRTPTS